MTVRVERERHDDRGPLDFTIGCGQPPVDHQPGQPHKSGRICAALGTQPSCALCPDSPGYWRKT